MNAGCWNIKYGSLRTAEQAGPGRKPREEEKESQMSRTKEAIEMLKEPDYDIHNSIFDTLETMDPEADPEDHVDGILRC